jgi:hypothetical protein
MRRLYLVLFSLLLVFLVSGCTRGRTLELERQVADLQGQLAAAQQKLLLPFTLSRKPPTISTLLLSYAAWTLPSVPRKGFCKN